MTNIHDIDHQRRIDLTTTVMQMLEDWQVPVPQRPVLLGFTGDIPLRKFKQYLTGTPFPDNPELDFRLHLLLSMQKAVWNLFPHNELAANLWFTSPNQFFANRTPLSYMLEHDVQGMQAVLDHLTGEGDWGTTPKS